MAQSPGWLDRLGEWFEGLVNGVRAFYAPLADMRITIIALALGGALLLGVDAGKDVVRELVDAVSADMSWSRYFWTLLQWAAFLLACVWTGINAWYWAHLLYKSKPGSDANQPQWFTWFRRFLGVLPLVFAVLAMYLSTRRGADALKDIWVEEIVFIASGGLMMWFFIARDGIVARMAARNSALVAPAEVTLVRLEPGRVVRGDVLFVYSTIAVSIAAFVLLLIPVVRTEWSWAMGAAALTFGAIGCIVPITSLMILAVRRFELPFVVLGAACFVLFSWWNDNHTLQPRSGGPPKLASVDEALAAWNSIRGDDPMVLVATAGGASRAAYWTGTVLRALDDRTGGTFSDHVFAISSVSGGTLGAIGYAAWLSDRTPAIEAAAAASAQRREFVQDFFGEDYLGPAMGAMLYVDLVQRFLPYGFLPDRATSLEEAFAMGWDRSAKSCAAKPCTAQSGRLAQEYTSLWANARLTKTDGRWVPIVLANGTHVETGKRVITAPVRIDSAVFEDAYDFYDLNPARISASTAVLNSARFTFVSPPGRLMKNGATTGGIIDGGYFENGGLETLYDLARYIRSRPEPENRSRKIIIIEIINDDTMDADDLVRHDGTPGALDVAPPPSPTLFSPVLSEITSVIGGLYETRSARGTLGAKRLSLPDRSGLTDTTYFSFALPPYGPDEKWHTAMSWALSLGSRDLIDGTFDPGPHDAPNKGITANRQTLQNVVLCVRDARQCSQ